jgi:signal transduction histidine kinase
LPEKAFEMFSRVQNDEVFRGTGIGLGIVAKCVGQMGGRLGVESELAERQPVLD